MKNKTETIVYDFVVIGAGMGGLTTAALLCTKGHEVLLIDSHYYTGGCASYFKRKEGFYDVGATTLSGLKSGRPFNLVMNKTKLKLSTKRQKKGIIVHHPQFNFIFHGELEKFKREFVQKLNINIDDFIDEIYELEEKLWDLLGDGYTFPKPNLSLFAKGPKLFKYRKYFYRNFFDCLPKIVQRDKRAIEIIDQLLLISTQQTSRDCPAFIGIMGFLYPLDTNTIDGGMRSLCRSLENVIRENDGEIKLNQAVTSIHDQQYHYQITTEKGIFNARKIIFNCPPQAIVNILKNIPKKSRFYEKFEKLKGDIWGCYSAYFSLKNLKNLKGHYHQILLTEKDKKLFNTDSLFLSFSTPNKNNITRVTVSTHVNKFDYKDKDEKYYIEKENLQKLIHNILANQLKDLEYDEYIFDSVATPLTWRHYTRRPNGEVGGLRHNNIIALLRLLPNFDKRTNFYHVGDYSFPGQGICSVMQGALNIIKILEEQEKQKGLQ